MAAPGTTYPKRTSSYIFQLPAIPIHSESLTAGTDIPPPPPSPPARKSSLAQVQVRGQPQADSSLPPTPNPLQAHPSTSSFALPLSATMPGTYPQSPFTSPSPEPSTALPPIDYVTSQPRTGPHTISRADSTSTSRSNSVRKFLSLRSLNGSWNNHNAPTTSTNSRPESPGGISTTSTRPSLNKKRSSVFWGRRKSSMMLGTRYEEGMLQSNGQDRENIRPSDVDSSDRPRTPPPMLPELEKLGGGIKKGEGGFLGGDDMFRNIK